MKPAKAWYKDWFNSPFYHKLYFERNGDEATTFIRNLVQHLQPASQSRMLDVACGRGRHCRTLAELGFQVTGIDMAMESILYARHFENEKLEFFQHDMRLPFRVNYFDYAFNFFTSFGYFDTRREHDDAIRTIAGSLKPNGVFVLDYLNVHYTEDQLTPQEEIRIDETVFEIRRWDDATHFYKKIVVHDPSLSEPEVHTEKVCKFSLGDFTDMLSYQRLQVKEVFGDYRLNAYHVRHTPRLIVIAKK